MPKSIPDIEIPVTMNKLQEKIYNWIELDSASELEEGADKWKLEEWKQAKTVRILQASTNPRLILDDDSTFGVKKLTKRIPSNRKIVNEIDKLAKNDVTPKLKKVCQIAEDLATCSGKYKSKDGTKKNVIIYTLFVGNVDILGSNDSRNPGFLTWHSKKNIFLDPICITGNNPTTTKEREKRITQFKNWDPDQEKCGKILIATLGSIAEAVSLHKNDKCQAVCQHVIYLERSFNAGQFMQSKYRVRRIGSDKRKPIQYYYLKSVKNARRAGGVVDTIDEDVHVTLAQRERDMHRLLSDPMHLLAPVIMEVETHKDKAGRKLPWGHDITFDQIQKRIQKRLNKKS